MGSWTKLKILLKKQVWIQSRRKLLAAFELGMPLWMVGGNDVRC